MERAAGTPPPASQPARGRNAAGRQREHGRVAGAVDGDDPASCPGALPVDAQVAADVHARAGRALHHIIDPVTGAPADTPLGSATVIAGDAWRAEVLATAVLVAGGRDQAARLVETAGATGLVVAAPGAWHALPGLEPFLS
jgi:hypothetical protein